MTRRDRELLDDVRRALLACLLGTGLVATVLGLCALAGLVAARAFARGGQW